MQEMDKGLLLRSYQRHIILVNDDDMVLNAQDIAASAWYVLTLIAHDMCAHGTEAGRGTDTRLIIDASVWCMI